MEFLADLQMESPTVPTENLARQIKRKWLSEPRSTANNYTVQLYVWDQGWSRWLQPNDGQK